MKCEGITRRANQKTYFLRFRRVALCDVLDFGPHLWGCNTKSLKV